MATVVALSLSVLDVDLADFARLVAKIQAEHAQRERRDGGERRPRADRGPDGS